MTPSTAALPPSGFRAVLAEFRDLMTSARYLATTKPDNRAAAKRALTLEYLRTGDGDTDATYLRAALDEHRRREAYMDTRQRRRRDGATAGTACADTAVPACTTPVLHAHTHR
jgi:hypothetical protein